MNDFLTVDEPKFYSDGESEFLKIDEFLVLYQLYRRGFQDFVVVLRIEIR
jgi:hypothetical protein